MVKIEHTVFALPFAFMSGFLAIRQWPGVEKIAWIFIAMVGARSAAMAFNRLVDLPFDSKNPRTSGRALPQRLVTKGFTAGFIVVSSGVFIFAAFRLNTLSLALSPLALAIVFFYSFTKRFTCLSHIFLGLALAAAPVGAWIALCGTLGSSPLILGFAVLLWSSGFDIIYSCQDVDFDRKESLHSIPARLGVAVALRISAIFHLVMIGSIAFLFWKEDLGAISYLGLVVVGLLLAYEHSLVRPGNLSRANTAFFTVNGWISILLFASIVIDLFL